jgi:hypothetical protein
VNWNILNKQSVWEVVAGRSRVVMSLHAAI